jgi:hypothetical protein
MRRSWVDQLEWATESIFSRAFQHGPYLHQNDKMQLASAMQIVGTMHCICMQLALDISSYKFQV